MQYASDLHHAAGSTAQLLKNYLSVSGVVFALMMLSMIWLMLGRGLRGKLLVLWLVVPALIGASCLAIAGPGRIFSKEPYEGYVLITFTPHDALTTLDALGLLCFVLSIGFASALIIAKRRRAQAA